jgi:hypothetical protein
MPSRWEQLLESKPVPILEALLDEVAQLVCRELARWPLPVEAWDPQVGQSFASLIAADSPRPGAAVFTTAFQTARWELERNHHALDDFLRNQRYLAHGVAPDERTALLFVTRWLVEQLFALGEATQGRVKRGDWVRCLERAESRWRASPGAPLPG